jgi:hypothetical protein
MKNLFSVLFMVATSFSVGAQVSQPARWEQENKFMDEAYSVVSLKEEGLALLRDKEKYDDGKKLWDLVILDTALNQRWTKELPLRDDLRFTGYEYTPGKVHLMFRRNETEILRAEILSIDLASQTVQQSSNEVKLQIRLTHYTVVDGNSVFGGYVGSEPVLLIYDPFKNQNIIVPGFFLTDTELLDVRPNKNNTFNILLSQRTQGRKKIIFRTLDKLGNILVEDEMAIPEERTVLSGASSLLEHDEVLIAGAYAFNNTKQAAGIFSCLIDPFAEQHIEFTEFHQLQHFLDYLSDKKAGKIKAKASLRENYGKQPEFRTNVAVHRIEEFKGGFAVFGESFQLSSSSSGSTFASPYYNNPTSRGYGYPSYYQPFSGRYYNNPYLFPTMTTSDEMRMLEGFVIGFDSKGKRLWDYTIPMNDYKVLGRDQVSDFTVVRSVPHFLYKDKDELKFSNHSTDTLEVSEAKAIAIQLKSEYEESKSTDEHEGNVRHWYGANFYVWGIQTVKDLLKRRDSDPSRRVFFINKVTVE